MHVIGLQLTPATLSICTAAGNEELASSRIQDDEDSMHPLWGLTEASIVDSLMWGKHEKQFALPIEHLEAHCEIFGNSCASFLKVPSNAILTFLHTGKWFCVEKLCHVSRNTFFFTKKSESFFSANKFG